MRPVRHTYSLTEPHILAVKLLAEELHLSEAEVVRLAIDKLATENDVHIPTFKTQIYQMDNVTRLSDLLEMPELY